MLGYKISGISIGDHVALAERLKSKMYIDIPPEEAKNRITQYWNHPQNKKLRENQYPIYKIDKVAIQCAAIYLLLQLDGEDRTNQIRGLAETVSHTDQPKHINLIRLAKPTDSNLNTEELRSVEDAHFADAMSQFREREEAEEAAQIEEAKSDPEAWDILKTTWKGIVKRENQPIPPEIAEIFIGDRPPKIRRTKRDRLISLYERFLLIAAVAAVYYGTNRGYRLGTNDRKKQNAFAVVGEATPHSKATVKRAWDGRRDLWAWETSYMEDH